MFENQTEQSIRERMLEAVSNTIEKREGSFTYDAIAPVALELAIGYVALDTILELVFAQTSNGEYLDMRANEFGIYRQEGKKATTTVIFEGVNNTVIPDQTVVQTDGGLQYITQSEAQIVGGTASVTVEAEQIGIVYNVPSNIINHLPIQINGVTKVYNPDPIVNGEDIENDESLLKRLLIKTQTPATSGNANHYKLWAIEVDGVGDAKVFPTWNGNGTVKVVLIDTERKPASSEIVSNVAQYIERERPIGAEVTVVSATAKPINIGVKITLQTGSILQDVLDAYTAKVVQYLKDIAFKQGYVSYAYLGSLLLSTEGIADYSNFVVNGSTANVIIGAEEVATKGTITLTV